MKKFLCLLAGAGFSLCVHAEIYKQVDANGHVTYSNIPSKGAIKLDIDPAPASAPAKGVGKTPGARTATPPGFPRVDKNTQAQRDDKRRQVLQDELANERKALEEARKNYAEGEAKPEVFTTAGGKTNRNVAKFDEKMQGLQAQVSLHEKNIQLLEKELASLK